MMITTTVAIKSYFLVIVALASVMGSALAATHISNLVNDFGSTSSPSEPSSSLIPAASAQEPPFEVDQHPNASAQEPPFVVYQHPNASSQEPPFVVDQHLTINETVDDPARIEEDFNDAEQHCEMECKYIEYRPGPTGKAGLAFTSDAPLNLSGAEKVRFFLMGENGSEKVEVKIAGKNPLENQTGDDAFRERFPISINVTLGPDWERYEVPLDGVDLKNITAPFAIELFKGRG